MKQVLLQQSKETHIIPQNTDNMYLVNVALFLEQGVLVMSWVESHAAEEPRNRHTCS